MKSLSALGSFPKDIGIKLPRTMYENIFRMYEIETPGQKPLLYYNILNSIYFPESLLEGTYTIRRVMRIMPWTAISYDEYRTIHLWWLIIAANNITNPVYYPAPGSELKIIKKELIAPILNSVNIQLTR